MLSYIPVVLLGAIGVYRYFFSSVVKTYEKSTQTETWTGLAVLDLMQTESDTSSTMSCEWGVFNSDFSSRESSDTLDDQSCLKQPRTH